MALAVAAGLGGTVTCAAVLLKLKEGLSQRRVPVLGDGPDDMGGSSKYPHSKVLTLRDGRQLGYIILNCEEPARANKVFFFVHGLPGSRLDAGCSCRIWRLPVGVCCIGIDRPGIGLSSFQRGRRVADFAADVLELADALGVQHFGVFGISGGGPYVAACGAKIPTDRLVACFDCSGIGALNVRPDMLVSKPSKLLFQQIPALLAGMLVSYQMTKTFKRGVPFHAEQFNAPEPDCQALHAYPDLQDFYSTAPHEATRCGSAGLSHEIALIRDYSSWGFTLNEVRVPYFICHGTLDKNVPLTNAAWYSENIPQSRLCHIDGYGHFSVIPILPQTPVWNAFFAALCSDVPDANADKHEPSYPLESANTNDSFSFVVPECSPGIVLEVPIPGGTVALQISVPQNVLPGDTMYMSRSPNGEWGISQVTRAEKEATLSPQGPKLAPPRQWRSKEDLTKDLAGPSNKTVMLHTTKGSLRLTLVPEWAPLGVQRFCELVEDQFFSQIAIYRGIAGFLVQFGIRATSQGEPYAKISDDPLIGIPIEEGSVCFAASGPNTRSNTICLWLGDFPNFGKSPWETPIGKVCPESLTVMHSLFTGYGDIPQCGGTGVDPVKLQELGNEYVKSNFPETDFITGAEFA